MTYNYGKGENFKWLKANVNYAGDDCLQWPFGGDRRLGRGKIGYKGKMYWAHRLMCILAHGDPPTPKHQTAHSCGNGDKGCVNPRHLSWKTNKGNSIDRVAHGRQPHNDWGRKGKLTPKQVDLLKSKKGKQTQIATAKEFGVSLSLVQYHWHGRERWPSHKRA